MKTLLLTFTASAMVFAQAPAQPKAPPPPGLTLTSSAFEDGGVIPNKYTQAGEQISPKLTWTNVPNGTQSFAIIFHDPDVALQKGTGDVLHWMIFNIPGTARELAEGAGANPKPEDGSVNAKNLRGQPGYMGPGAGAQGPYHHYTFEMFALDSKLELDGNASRADVMKAMEGHIVGKAILFGRFHR
jgi:Raf kinase inhibitor-like YbhB/YbcL family protein